jgi:diguanylate cyclase (GGDEF)-like protein
MKIRQKIALSFGAIIILVVSILSYVALISAGKLGQRLDSVYNDAMLPFEQAEVANEALSNMQIALSGAIGETGSKKQQYLDEFSKSEKEYTEAVDKYDKEYTIVTQPAMQNLLRHYGALEDQMTREENSLKEVKHAYPLLKSTSDTILGLLKNRKKAEALAIYNNKAASLFARLDEHIKVFMRLQLEQGEYSSREVQSVLTLTKQRIGYAIVAALVLGFSLILGLTHILIRPLNQLRDAALQLGQGQMDTRISIHSKDEFGELAAQFNTMAANLANAHEKLRTSMAELECRNSEAGTLSEMADLLQSCFTLEEASGVIASSAQKLFHGFSGAVLVFSASRNVLEANTTWGKSSPVERVFSPNDCWALRRGSLHHSGSDEGAVRCTHFGSDSRLPCLCTPLMAHGETLGILCLVTEPNGEAPSSISEFNVQLAVSVAEQAALSFANLKLREKLRYQSIRDPLTGLFNRRYLDESLERELPNALRKNRSLGVIMLDVDRFKKFNDMFGHDAGDTVLRELGDYLAKFIRRGDLACRYGGEEFTLILPECSLEDTRRRAEELRISFQQLSIKHRDTVLGKVTLSLGVAVLPDHGTTAVELLSAADGALLRAKEEGRDRVLIAEVPANRAG